MTTGAPDPQGALPGRVTVSARALERVFAALAAEELGAEARRVAIRLADDRGRLRVQVTGPAARPRSGGTLIDAGRRTQSRIRDDGGRITGREISTVGVRISAGVAPEEGPR